MSREEVIDQYFKLFKLDNRASQTELEIAYDVLTKGANLSNEEYAGYRLAFEYLMCNYYGINQADEDNKKESYDKPIDLDKVKENKVYSKVLSATPQDVLNNLEEFEKLTGEKLNDKVKVLFATQPVNLPAFFNSINKNKSNLFGQKVWSLSDMSKILKETVFNNLTFNTIYCELFNNIKYKNELLLYVNSLKNIFTADKNLCKYFRIEEFSYGIIFSTTLEGNMAKHLKSMVEMKCEAIGTKYIMSSDFD